MRRSNTPAARSCGFTLIELLVVVVIIALIAATAVLSIGTVGRDTELEKESDRALALLDYTREQAELRTREFGLLCEENGYQFVTFDPRRGIWVVMETDEVLRPRELPDGLSLALVIEGRPIVLERPDDATDLTPQVMLFSNGDMTSFELTLQRLEAERSITIAVDEKGTLEEKPMQERKT